MAPGKQGPHSFSSALRQWWQENEFFQYTHLLLVITMARQHYHSEKRLNSPDFQANIKNTSQLHIRVVMVLHKQAISIVCKPAISGVICGQEYNIKSGKFMAIDR